MKRVLLLSLVLFIGMTAFAQAKIQLRSTDRAECVKSDMTSLKASFSFSTIDAQDIQSERGTFSWLSLPNTVIGGNEGDPQIPVVNELIAIPVGAHPSIRVTSYSSTDYSLEDYGIHTLVPRQPDVRKDQRPEDVPFVYNAAAYQTRGLRSEPTVRVNVDGTMRGVQVGQMTIEPVSYDPANNMIRVFNDIEVEVSFNGADRWATEDLLVKTYSPYFLGLYDQLFNGRAVRDVYEDHPDLWKTPVKMLVIANRMFEDCIQDWLAWKTTKGFYVDVNYTDEIGTTASAIKTFIQNTYAADAPTFLMIMGDKDQVPASATGSATSCVTDLSYSSVDGDEFVDMFHSRFPAETVAQMTAMLNKALEYEQYTMPDPSYLNNVLLIAGEDSSGWGETVGRPTIWYATNYYYNAEHGFQNVYEFSHGTYTNCYSYLSSGVGFANYTAHGSNTSWAGPSFTVSDVSNLTNEHKYFLAMGNCCQAADWGISGTSFGEAMVRAENKGAYAYIGSCPSTYWKNDYYFGVGPTNRADGTMPTMEETGTGCYDAIWNDDAYNTVNSILYIGNLAGNAASALGYELHISTLYYWQAYHVLGDGSIMPYRVQPTANQVSHMAILPIGMATYEVSAVPGSYVAISKDGVLHGTGLVDETGTVQVDITPVTSSGDVTICVTAPNRIPYVQTVPAAALEGAYISMDSYTPTATHVGDNTNLSITFKNVGTAATSGNTNITLTSTDTNVTVDSNHNTGSFGTLAADATTTVSGFQFSINPGVADGTNVTMHYVAENGDDTYEGNIVVKANEAVLEYQNMAWNGGFTPGETLTLSAKFKNTGHYQATNAVIELTTTANNYITINTQQVTAGTIEAGQEVTYDFSVTIADNCPETAVIPVTFAMTADGGLTATGTENLKNACNVIFNLADSYGDGWNGAALVVSFDDGTESQSLTVSNGNSAEYVLEIGNGTHVTLTWSSGSYDGECSFTVSYEGDLVIFQQTSRPTAGVLYEFDCNCAAASLTYLVTVESENTEHGTVSGGGEYSFGESCTVTATPAEGYYFVGWLQDGELVEGAGASYTFIVNNDVSLVATFAEGLMIGDGGSTTDQYLPSYSYYNYTLSQQIYTAEELGSAGLISSIAFFNGGTTKTRNYDVYLVSTTKSTFSGATDWVTVTSDNLLYSGSVEMTANDWTTIEFSNPFVYDGVSNVVLVVDDNTGSYSQGMLCSVFNAPSQALRVYSDGTNYNPLAPSSYSGTVMNVKNQLMVTKSPLDGCVNATPSAVEVSDITYNAATVSWTGFSESYNVMLGISNMVTLVDEDFAEDIPSDWVNSTDYPWKIVDGSIQSGNAGVASSTSSISITLNFSVDGTIEFDAECMGEGTKGVKTVWDKCIFSIDGVDQFTNGAVSGWKHYSYEVAAGNHTFTWSYSKDSSVDPDGDYFAIDNVVARSVEVYWDEPIAVEDVEYTFNRLNPRTDYCVRVQGVCDGNQTDWSANAYFTTGAITKYIAGYGDGTGGWYLIASPVADAFAPTADNGFLTYEFDLYRFNQSADKEWENWEQEDFNIEPGKGYLYANSEGTTLTFTGSLITETEKTIKLQYEQGHAFSGWNLVGNPFGVNAYIDRPFYVMKNGNEIIAASDVDRSYIEPMEGIFVIAEVNDEPLTFTTEKPSKGSAVTLNLSNDGGVVDRAIVRFDESRQLPKFMLNESNTKMYITKGGSDYAVVRSDRSNRLPVNFEPSEDGMYVISTKVENVAVSTLYLVDHLRGIKVDLLNQPEYEFVAKVTDKPNRFELVYKTGTSSFFQQIISRNDEGEEFGFVSDGNLIINNEGKSVLQVIDVTGRILSSETINGSYNKQIDAAPGVYLLRLVNGDDVKTQKILIK